MESGQPNFVIRFDGLSKPEASAYIRDLQRDLAAVEGVTTRIIKDDPTNQDFGATLILVLGTPAVIALAKHTAPMLARAANAIADNLSRNRAKITIEADGRVVAEKISGDDAARIAEAFARRP